MAKKVERLKYINITDKPPSTGDLLYNKFVYVYITILNGSGNVVKKLSLMKVRADLTFTGTLNTGIGNTTVKGTVTLYTNLSGYDENTSLMQQIKTVIDSNKEIKGKSASYVSMEIFCGYLGMVGYPYGFAGNVLRITSERNTGIKSQAWRVEFIQVELFGNTVDLVWKKETKQYIPQGVSYSAKDSAGKTITAEGKGATYLQILKDIYTPKDYALSTLEDLSNPTMISEELKALLDVQMVTSKDEEGKVVGEIFTINYTNYGSKSYKGVNPFAALLRDFWVRVKKDLKLNNLFLTTVYKPNSSGVIKAVLSLTDQEYEQKTYAYLDDSKILGAPFIAEAAFIEINTIFDPSVFYRDGVVIKSRYFNILTVPKTTGLIEDNKSDIINRNLNQEDKDLNLPIWYVISYTVNFSNFQAEPATMVLNLSRDLPPYLVG